MKKDIKKVVKRMCVKFEKKIYPVVFMNIADLLMPVKGVITSSQIIIAARILDIENYYEHDESFKWQERFTNVGGG